MRQSNPIQSNDQVLKWILLEADMWVDPPLVEQIFIIESSRWENFENLFLNRLLAPSGALVVIMG